MIAVYALLGLLQVASTGETLAGAPEPARPLVFVSILPQKYFVERIAGGAFEVETLVPPGQSMETFEPTPKQLARLGEARAFFCVGAPFEKQVVDRIQTTFKTVEIVDTREGTPLRRFTADEACHNHLHHGHGHAHEAEAGEPDPHIWLDPNRVKIQIGVIREALGALAPEADERFEENRQAFADELDGLDARLREALEPVRGRTLYVHHAAFGYFADAYGLKQAAVELGGREPGPRQLAALIERAKRDGARVIFTQPQFSPRSAEILAREIGGAVVSLDDLAEDYMNNMERIAETIHRQLADQAG